MAKKKYYYKPTKSQRKRLAKLYRGLGKTRKYLKEQKQLAERSLLSDSSRITADLVLPKDYDVRYQFKSREEYLQRVTKLKEFTSIQRYVREHYKNTVLQLYRDNIIGEEPQGINGRYTREQEEANPEMADLMVHYNKMTRMSGYSFYDAYTKGYIKSFKYIYAEMMNQGNTRGEDSQVSEAMELLDDYLEINDYE